MNRPRRLSNGAADCLLISSQLSRGGGYLALFLPLALAGSETYVPGKAAYIAAQRTRCSIGTESLTVCATSSAAGPKPTQGMPNMPAMETPFVLNVQRLTGAFFLKSFWCASTAAATCGASSSST